MTDADLSHKRELADAANALSNDRAFTQAVLSLRKRWFEEWLASSTDEQARGLKAQIKALEAIPQELSILINDYKMAVKR
jgi:hypothetical protein